MKNRYLTIETSREGYEPEQLDEWCMMKVSDLIAILEEYDGNLPVIFSNDGGYTYGNIYAEGINHVERFSYPDRGEEGEEEE